MRSMNDRPKPDDQHDGHRDGQETIRSMAWWFAVLPWGYALIRWLGQPPVAWGWCAPLALVPLLWWIRYRDANRRGTHRLAWLWLASFAFWAVSLQGLRHAHPLLYFAWIALAGYLGVYVVLFAVVVRRMRDWSVPWIIAVPVTWVGCEWIRNYLLTGISACMLGHSFAPYSRLIQIADTFGSYGVSFLVAMLGAAIFQLCQAFVHRREFAHTAAGVVAAGVTALACFAYGEMRLRYQPSEGDLSVALLGLDEQTEYDQDEERPKEIFYTYARKCIEVAKQLETDSARRTPVVVWPESMYSGGLPWMEVATPFTPPEDDSASEDEYRRWADEWQQAFALRAADMQRAWMPTATDGEFPSVAPEFSGGPITGASADKSRTHLIGGCGVVIQDGVPRAYSGLVHLTPALDVDWYGKNHLVMFGEYIPILSTWPVLKEWVPPGLGLAFGDGPKTFTVGQSRLLANICIETAVERVAVNHVREIVERQSIKPDAIVTVTNDAWFDHTAVVQHHLRCDQFVALGCRTPVLSAGNGGPTAWIDSFGCIVDRVPHGRAGHIIAQPKVDRRSSAYLMLGDRPAALAGFGVLGVAVLPPLLRRVRRRRTG
ncbi:apolipoprotein N-acyltransferase [Crateriforma spongiae]|uniref:apolipoprotein N-acyltransferase n=1 Tax=Crateriforma spongiae TaxID=2724528 RepID=UPI0014460A52|nr:apolipoprotein N-acyltransferase [Crateriforma spongiae]